MEFFNDFALNHWTWFVIGLILVGLEILAPGVVFLWMAIASAIVGAIVYFIPQMAWEMQFIVFSVLSIISVIAGRQYLAKNPLETEDNNLNKRGEQYIGQIHSLDRDMKNGESKIRIGDSLWKVRGDFEATGGEAVRITDTEGTVLMVEKE